MQITAIYPGTFDPITNGHVDLVIRAARIFDRIILAVAENKAKTPLFGLEERLALAADAVADIPTVDVISFDNLLVDPARLARGVGLRVRVSAGRHEPLSVQGTGDHVSDSIGKVRLHLVLLHPRNRQAGGRRLRLRVGPGAAGAP
jgi:cytidyltransferase-like protein